VFALHTRLQESQAACKAAESARAQLSAQLSTSQAAVAERDAALDALADELVSVSGLCDEHAAAKEQVEQQVRMWWCDVDVCGLPLCCGGGACLWNCPDAMKQGE
jgi:chromosome segregation ATPase